MNSVLFLLVTGCSGSDAPDPPTPGNRTDSGSPVVTDTATDTDTGGVTLPESCVAPSPLPTDPLTAVGALFDGDSGAFYELTDLEVLADQDRVIGVGQGGLLVFDLADDDPSLVVVEPDHGNGRVLKIERLGDDLFAATNWNAMGPTRFVLYDLTDSSSPQVAQELDIDLPSGMAWSEPYLYVLTLDGKLEVLDVSDRDVIERVDDMLGLASPYEMEIVGQWGYVADAPLGLVPIDLTDPTGPAMGAPVESAIGAWDVATDDDYVYVASGSAGILIYDLADPSSPALVSHLDDVGSVVGVDVDGDLLAAVSHADLVVFDITDRASPVPLAKQDHNQFGLAVQIVDERIYVADWGFLSVWDIDASVRSPEADVQSSELYFYGGSDSKALEITNLGADALELLGATAGDARITVRASGTTVAPGESAELVVTYTDRGDGEALETTLCLATNDPDEPLVEVFLGTTSTDGVADLAVGQPAPDFTLQTLDGDTLRLSDQLGTPVVLIYFATW